MRPSTSDAQPDHIVLAHADAEAIVDPSAGAVRALRFAGVDILRPAARGATHPFELSSFVLSPFANRIAFGKFLFGGREVLLGPAEEAHPHALHGLAWRAQWTLVRSAPEAIVLRARSAGGAWPWDHEATQTIALDSDGFTHSLSVVNRAAAPMPVSIGFHPYFASPDGARVAAATEAMWETDGGILPSRLAQPPKRLSSGVFVDDLPPLDNCFSGWSGKARLSAPGRGFDVVVSASENLAFLHIYKPVDADFFCLEPVSAMPDSFNRREGPEVTGLRVLEPGAALHANMTIRRALPE